MNKEQAEEMLKLLRAIKNNTDHTFLMVSIIAATIVIVAWFRASGYL